MRSHMLPPWCTRISSCALTRSTTSRTSWRSSSSPLASGLSTPCCSLKIEPKHSHGASSKVWQRCVGLRRPLGATSCHPRSSGLSLLASHCQLLDSVVPCCAVYGDTTLDATRRTASELNANAGAPAAPLWHELGVPVERTHEPVLCLQEARVHSKSHRGSRRVRGGGSTIWQRLSSLAPHNPVWPGAHKPAAIVKPDLRDAVAEVVQVAFAPPAQAAAALVKLQRSHSSSAVDVVFVPLSAAAPAASTPDATRGIRLCSVAEAHAAGAAVVLPYCFLCSRKVLPAPDVISEAPSAAAGAAVALDRAEEGAAAEVGYGEWLVAAFHEVSRLAMPAVVAPRPADALPRGGARGSPRSRAPTAAGEKSSAAARQCVPLGLCAACLDCVRDASADGSSG